MVTSEDLLIKQHLPLVRRTALQLLARLPANVQLDDLMQAGMMGLLDAVRRYQFSEDAQFETYAVTRIRGSMLDELRSQDWLPRSVRSKAKTIEHAMQRLVHRLLRPASEHEIADELGLSLESYQLLESEARGVQVLHYEDLVRADESTPDPLGYLVNRDGYEPDTPLDKLMSQALRLAIITAIEDLPEREKLVLSLHFEQDLNQKEIASVLSVTEGRVSQLKSQAVLRIRADLMTQGWLRSGKSKPVKKGPRLKVGAPDTSVHKLSTAR